VAMRELKDAYLRAAKLFLPAAVAYPLCSDLVNHMNAFYKPGNKMFKTVVYLEASAKEAVVTAPFISQLRTRKAKKHFFEFLGSLLSKTKTSPGEKDRKAALEHAMKFDTPEQIKEEESVAAVMGFLSMANSDDD